MPKTSKKSKGSKKVKIVSKPNVNGNVNVNNATSTKRRTLSKLFNALRISQRVATPYPRPSRQIRCKTLYP